MPAKPLLVLAALAWAAPVSAQLPAMPLFEPGLKALSLQLGRAAPTDTGGFDRVTKAGPVLNLQFLYFPLDWVAFGPELSYFKLGKKSAQPAVAALSLVTRLNMLQEKSWTPYVLGGVGYHSFSYSVSAPANPGDCDPLTGKCGVAAKASSSGLTVTAGAGVETFIIRGLSLSFEARYHDFELSGKKFTTNAETLSFLLGFRYWFSQ